jgi:hypothetical protein
VGLPILKTIVKVKSHMVEAWSVANGVKVGSVKIENQS